MKHISLPFESDDKLGYSTKEINTLCRIFKVKRPQFNKAFGCNTCAIAKDGTIRYYKCDIETAFNKLGIKTKNNGWD